MIFRKHFGPSNQRVLPATIALLSVVLLTLAAPVRADTPPVGLSLDDAIAVVRQQIDGKVLRARPRTTDGRAVYEIRVLTEEGLVKTLTVDALSGQVR